MVVETLTSSSHMYQPSDEDVTEITKLMSDGKRNYVCNQPHLALDCFVELCEKLAKWYGQESDKCVEAYLYYGKTLLDIARLENGVLGHAIKEMPIFESQAEDEEEEIKGSKVEDEEDVLKPEDIRTQVERALREDNLYNVSTDEQTEDDDDDDITHTEEGDEGEREGGGVTSTSTSTEDHTTTTIDKIDEPSAQETTATEHESTAKSEVSGNGDQMDDDDGIDCEGSDEEDTNDVSNLELSWEMLELTSVICRKQLQEEGCDIKAVKTTLAEAKHGLAQISLEMERYEDATNDFTECLDLYKEVLEDKNDRVIAEGHYNVALALSFDQKYLEAIESFEKAVLILKSRVSDLEHKVKSIEEKEEKADDQGETELEEWKKEINELNDLIVLDMMAKIEDAHESKKLLDESINTVKIAADDFFSKSGFDAGFTESLPTDEQVPHDCTDQIRPLKRKSDDEVTEVHDIKPKQLKCDEVVEPKGE